MFSVEPVVFRVGGRGCPGFCGVFLSRGRDEPEKRSDNATPRQFNNSHELLLTRHVHVVILSGMYVRTVRVPSSSGAVNEYVRVVEAYREQGKVRQRVVADLGRKDLLCAMLPKLRRVLEGTSDAAPEEDLEVLDASTWGPILVLRHLFEQLGLWPLLDEVLRRSKGVPYADRVFALLANRLTCPKSEHGLARWLETDFVCDRQGRGFVPPWDRRGRGRGEGGGKAAQRAGDRGRGDGGRVADCASRLGGQPGRSHHGAGGRRGPATAVLLRPDRLRGRPGDGDPGQPGRLRRGGAGVSGGREASTQREV